jgi:hypothetical protein
VAVRPSRSEVLSTRPIYLPIVPSNRLTEIVPEKGKRRLATTGITLFSDVASAELPDIETLKEALKGEGIIVDSHGDFFASRLILMTGTRRREAAAAAANALAWARVRNPSRREYAMLPLRGEIDHEMARLHARLHPGFGSGGLDGGRYGGDLLYDAAGVQQVYRDLLPEAWSVAGRAVVITDRALAAWDEEERAWRRQHATAGTPGVVAVSAELSLSQLATLVRLAAATSA